MAEVQPRGEIYDLGYRNYDGDRLGRGYAFRSLMTISLRHTFGFGRGPLPKVLAFGLTTLAFLPAIATVITGAIAGSDFEFVQHSEYYEFIRIIIVLFVAAMASELVGNDRKNNTLVLYFSRPIRRNDYIMAKVAALSVALLALTLLPQLLIFVGNWLGADDGADWFGDNAGTLWRIVVSAVVISVQLATIGLAIAVFTKRRAFALISVLATMLVSVFVSAVLVGLLDRSWGIVAAVISPLVVMEAVTLVIFDAVPRFFGDPAESSIAEQVAYLDLDAWIWLAVLAGHVVIAMFVAMRRYRRAL